MGLFLVYWPQIKKQQQQQKTVFLHNHTMSSFFSIIDPNSLSYTLYTQLTATTIAVSFPSSAPIIPELKHS